MCLTENQRQYFEKGDDNWRGNIDLSKSADKAARYEGLENGKPKYAADYSRNADGSINHEAVISNVMRWVDDTLSQDGDPANTPYFTVKEIVDKFGGINDFEPGKDVRPAPGQTWVCIDHAIVLAYTLRALGYPVREKNVTLSKEDQPRVHKYTYQEAAVNVWHKGKWHYGDAYKGGMKEKKEIFQHYPGQSDLNENAAKGPIDWSQLGNFDKNSGNMNSNAWESLQTLTKATASIFEPTDATRIGLATRIDDPYTGFDPNTGMDIANIPYSFYESENAPIFLSHKNTIPVGFLDERIDIGFAGLEPSAAEFGSYFYDLIVMNISDMPSEYLIQSSANRNFLIWSFDTFSGQLDPGSSMIYKVHLDVVPEPSTLLLLGSGLAGIIGFGRRRLLSKRKDI